MHLLHRLARGILNSASDSMVENDDFLDAREPLLEHMLDLGVVAVSYGFLIGKGLLFGGTAIYGEARIFGREFVFAAADVVDGALIVSELEGGPGSIDLHNGSVLVLNSALSDYIKKTPSVVL